MTLDFVLRLPWWLHFIVGLVALGMALAAGETTTPRSEAIEAALARSTAPLVEFNELEVSDAPYTEAIFAAQVASDAVVEIETRIDENTLQAGTVIPLISPETESVPRAFRAFILVRGAIRADWTDYVAPLQSGEGPLGPILTIEGELLRDLPESQMVRGEIGEARVAADAVWVEPYMNGRRNALESRLDIAGWGPLPFYGTAIFFLAMAGARFIAAREPADD